MNEKGIQVATGLKKPRKTSTETQTSVETSKKDQEIQCGMAKGSYLREKEHRKWRYNDLIYRLHDKDILIQWLM